MFATEPATGNSDEFAVGAAPTSRCTVARPRMLAALVVKLGSPKTVTSRSSPSAAAREETGLGGGSHGRCKGCRQHHCGRSQKHRVAPRRYPPQMPAIDHLSHPPLSSSAYFRLKLKQHTPSISSGTVSLSAEAL